MPVLASIEPLIARFRWTSLHPERIRPAVEAFGEIREAQWSWKHPCHYFDGTEETVRWIFVADVLNHCFWPDPGEPVWAVEYRGEPYSGYWGLAAALKRAMESSVPITDARFLAEISKADLEHIFSGQGRMPMLEERLANLREAGRILLKDWQGDIVRLIEASNHSALQIIRKVVFSFPSFRDEATYKGQKVYLWKRAQIFASDLHSAFEGKEWGELHDIASLTAFADYKLPQVLREFGAISYHPELARKIDSLEYLPPGCEEEVEIRAMTVWAVEKIKKVFKSMGKEVTSTQVDNWLWQLGQLEPFRKRPYHRCRTVFY